MLLLQTKTVASLHVGDANLFVCLYTCGVERYCYYNFHFAFYFGNVIYRNWCVLQLHAVFGFERKDFPLAQVRRLRRQEDRVATGWLGGQRQTSHLGCEPQLKEERGKFAACHKGLLKRNNARLVIVSRLQVEMLTVSQRFTFTSSIETENLS